MYQSFSQTKHALMFQSGDYEIEKGNIQENFSELPGEVVFDKYIRLVQFNDAPNETTKRTLEASGARVLGYIPKNTYLVSLPSNYSFKNLGVNIRAVSPFIPSMKLSKNLTNENYPDWAIQGNKITLLLNLYPNYSDEEKKQLLNQLSTFFATEFTESNENEIEATVAFNVIDRLANLPFVLFIQSMEDPGEVENFRARTSHRAEAIGLESANAYQLDGSGVHVSLGDYDFGTAGPHIDFTGRLNDKSAGIDNGTNHGIHTMGTVFGAGNLDPKGKGMAPGAELTYYTYPQNLFAVDNDYANDNVRITSSSFSNNCNNYTNFTSRVDKDMVDNPKLVHVFSAGNNNGANCGYGAGNAWGNITGGHKQGKNVIAVANITSVDNIANSSSRGPAHDGRVKPDLGGVGTSVYSTQENNTYGSKTGTSMSCPGVAGTLALIYQGYKNFNGNMEPDGGLAKALLMNTADDLGNAHVDFIYGYGRINAFRAMECIEDDNIVMDTVTGNGSNAFDIIVPPGTKEVRVMLHWTDPQALANTSRALVNNLDLSVEHIASSTTYQPWVLNPTPNAALLNSTALRATDSLNNTEQFTLENPDTGLYTITVQGSAIPVGSQKYYVVYSFVSENLKLMAPFGGEVLNPIGNYEIRFEGVNLSGSSSIEYSIDNGVSWTSIVSGLNSSIRNYNWNIPNTTVSTQAKVRVVNGTDTSTSNTFSILRVPAGLSVDWVCIDSMQVSWNPVSGSIGYVAHLLGSEYMDSVGTTNQTQFIFKGINPNKAEWISISALDSAGHISQKAKAIKAPVGLFNCSFPYDAEVSQIIHPLGNYSNCLNPGNVSPSVLVFNRGTMPLDSISVYFQSGQTILNTLYTNVIQPGDSVFINFTGGISLSNGLNTLFAWCEHPKDNVWLNDTSTADVNLTSGTNFNTPYFQDFDGFALCPDDADCEAVVCSLTQGWYNEANSITDAIDFRTFTGSTPTNNTGPSQDHTSGNGNYLYLEGSNCFLKYSLLKSPCINVKDVNQELTFWYHMLGSEMGQLQVDIIYDGKIDLDVMAPIEGNQGNSWKQKQITLSKYSGLDIVVQFRAETGIWHRSDIAIDDIAIGESGIGIDELNSQNTIELRPNPATSNITLSWLNTVNQDAEIKILNNLGQSIYFGKWKNNSEWQLNIDSWSNGLYFIHVYFNDRHEFLKFIKQ